ncbi:hypothetical protein PG989_011879 [Apiospora arundinis]
MFQNNRQPCDARFKDDTGTPANWIHPSLAKRLKLDIEQLKEHEIKDFVDFNGKRYRPKQIVWFTMMGRDQKTYWDKYYLAPERSKFVDVILLGDEFVNTNGRARDVCNATPHASPVLPFVYDKKISKSDKEQMEAKEAQTNRTAQELENKRNAQRDRAGKSKGDGSKSRKQ